MSVQPWRVVDPFTPNFPPDRLSGVKAALPEPEIVTRQRETRLRHHAELDIAEEKPLKKGMEEKFREFTEKGNELYAKA
jgi:hypothetical protein